ncbi:MAG: hypothetical protein AAGK09_10125 [Planctomycetota bacterium]
MSDTTPTDRLVFKQDARSRVEWTPMPGTPGLVLKTFLHSPLKQRFTYALGLHPAQAERRTAHWLEQLRIPVVPIQSIGVFRSAEGRATFRVHILTAYQGSSLQHALGKANRNDHPRILAAVAPLVRQLLDRRIFFKDLKASNIVLGLDAPNTLDPKLIDTGSARRGLSPTQRQRMLDMLRQTCLDVGADPASLDRLDLG